MKRENDITMRRKLTLEYDSAIGETLRQLRVDRKLNQIDIALALGGGQAMVSKMESGQRSLRFAEVIFLANALGMPFRELIDTLTDTVDF